MITSKQLPIYDAASRKIEVAARELETINVAGIGRIDRERLELVIAELRLIRNEFYSKAHARFIAERMGEHQTEGPDGSCTDECVATHPDHADSRGK
jgi:hypothetical protein